MVGGVKGELFDDLVALVEKGQEFGRSEVRRRDERVVECLFAEEEPACGNGGGVSSHQRTVAAHQRRVICKLTENALCIGLNEKFVPRHNLLHKFNSSLHLSFLIFLGCLLYGYCMIKVSTQTTPDERSYLIK